MVCAKCSKLTKPTSLATPGVKKKAEMYYGSPAGSKKSGESSKATLGNTGVGKVRGLHHILPSATKIKLFTEQTSLGWSQEPLCSILDDLHGQRMRNED